MTASSKCPHTDFDHDISVAILTDCNVRMMHIRLRCKICGTPMQFLGTPIGVSLARPTSSPDGQEIRIPLVAEGEKLNKELDIVMETKLLARGGN